MDSNYIVLAVTLVVWLLLFGFLFGLDKKVKKLEEKVK